MFAAVDRVEHGGGVVNMLLLSSPLLAWPSGAAERSAPCLFWTIRWCGAVTAAAGYCITAR